MWKLDAQGHPVRGQTGVPERFYKRPEWFDNRNAEVKVIGALLGHKPTPTDVKFDRKGTNSPTIVPLNQSLMITWKTCNIRKRY